VALLFKTLGVYSDDGPFFYFFLSLCARCPFWLLVSCRCRVLKRARVFLFMGETVVGRPTGMFVSDKDREVFQRGRTGEWRSQVRLLDCSCGYFRGAER